MLRYKVDSISSRFNQSARIHLTEKLSLKQTLSKNDSFQTPLPQRPGKDLKTHRVCWKHGKFCCRKTLKSHFFAGWVKTAIPLRKFSLACNFVGSFSIGFSNGLDLTGSLRQGCFQCFFNQASVIYSFCWFFSKNVLFYYFICLHDKSCYWLYYWLCICIIIIIIIIIDYWYVLIGTCWYCKSVSIPAITMARISFLLS